MDNLKTFEGYSDLTVSDSLQKAQKEDVAKMRASLLSCSQNPGLARTALNNITVMRVYHQLARIIRYTEMCDKIEDKIYEALDHTLETASSGSNATWMILLEAQERLQKIMLDSQKLLEPYLKLDSFTFVDMVPDSSDVVSEDILQMNADTRENIRNQAQAVLYELKTGS